MTGLERADQKTVRPLWVLKSQAHLAEADRQTERLQWRKTWTCNAASTGVEVCKMHDKQPKLDDATSTDICRSDQNVTGSVSLEVQGGKFNEVANLFGLPIPALLKCRITVPV